jgi:hypothetical protein
VPPPDGSIRVGSVVRKTRPGRDLEDSSHLGVVDERFVGQFGDLFLRASE